MPHPATGRCQGGIARVADVLRFIPFDPATKMAEAVGVERRWRAALRIVKGAPAAIATVRADAPEAATELERLTAAGYRTLAVACRAAAAHELIGLIAFSDPPRADSRRCLPNCARWACTGDGHPAMRRPRPRPWRMPSGWRARFARPAKSPTASVPTILPSMPASSRKTSFAWSSLSAAGPRRRHVRRRRE